ncbi:barstar family protein [Streptomyces sp. N35]|uniref:barstar family protein n=1 Tax=Streptomyces sp. N35 TaxID=2795730 RepID=UPI0018F7A7DA|nr:barstar family protein [Streptomyces sp. N35]
MHEDKGLRPQVRYALADTEHGHVWGGCLEVDGLFGEPTRGTYELLGWAGEGAEARGLLGSRVWLVPQDETAEPWLLEDAESLGLHPGTDGLVLTGLDDCEGPPEGYRGVTRVHNEHRRLGSCQEFTRVLPPERAAPPLVLRGLEPSQELRQLLAKGTRRALDLGQAALQIRDDQGEPLTEQVVWTRIRTWHPSDQGADLIDLELDGESFTPVPGHVRPILERWFTGPPSTSGAWADLDTRRREAWLDLVQERGCRRTGQDRSAHHAYELDGRHITDVPGLYLALGEAVNGPGGYFGGCLDAVVDCLRGTFGYTAPATLLWRDAATAREFLSHILGPDGQPYDLLAELLGILAEGGMQVALM